MDPEKTNLNDEQPQAADTNPSVQNSVVGGATRSKRPPAKLVLLVLLALLIGGGAYMLIKSKSDTAPKQSTKKTVNAAAPIKKVSAFTPQLLPNGDTKVAERTWFKLPVKKSAANYKFFTDEASHCDVGCPEPGSNFSYYQVGTLDDGSELVVAVISDAGTASGLFITKDGTNRMIVHNSEFVYEGKPTYPLSSTTTIDESTIFPEITAPENITINGKNFIKEKYEQIELENLAAGLTKYGTSDYGIFYKDVKTTSPQSTYETSRYKLLKYDFNQASYLPAPGLDNLKAKSISFNGGDTNKDVYSTGFHGCTFGGSFEDILTDSASAVVATGKDSTGNQLYDFKDPASAEINQQTYADYKDSYLQQDKPYNSLADFLKLRPTLLYKNSLGSYSVLYNENVIAGGGCGKPVIYLYPTHKTAVSVKVDADIRVSEPAYKQGWNITANPNGTIATSDNKKYDSLYWEGYGQYYPEITGGFVVKQQDLAKTIDQHLTSLGLNTRERADFEAFWLAKLPTTPYVRLTWFGTADVNKMAPLHITPRPDTLIRVFLDYEGLQTPITIPTQHLRAIPRTGFTAIEWGGLLQSALPAKR